MKFSMLSKTEILILEAFVVGNFGVVKKMYYP